MIVVFREKIDQWVWLDTEKLLMDLDTEKLTKDLSQDGGNSSYVAL